jgi:riboflavin kinase/FMN adenylyltransferase
MAIDSAALDVNRLLAEGRVEEFTAIQGRPFQLSGVVVQGDQRGRTIGFPTANIVPRTGEVCPAIGVYAGVALGGPAAISVGIRPTFVEGSDVRVEVHLLDFCGDLYGSTLNVSFLAKVRDERRFSGPAELVEQLNADVEATRQIWVISRTRPN